MTVQSGNSDPTTDVPKANLEKRDMKKDESFKNCYLKNRVRLYWYIYRKISNSEESEDITAEVFLKLYQNWESVGGRGDSGVLAWLYTVSRNMCIDYLRKNSRSKSRSIENEEIDDATKVYEDHVGTAIKEEDLGHVMTALKFVDEEEREIVTLRFEQDMKFSEIASMMGKNEGACKMIFYRCIKKVRDKINELNGAQQPNTN